MPKDIDISKVQEKAARALYQKKFESSFKEEIQRLADRQGEQLARKLAKGLGFRKNMETLVRKWLKDHMDELVKTAMKDAMICW